MDFKELTYFVSTVQEGNISKAAEKLNISQPPLSTKLKELESELGVILFRDIMHFNQLYTLLCSAAPILFFIGCSRLQNFHSAPSNLCQRNV